MGTPTARNVAPAGSEYAETVRSNRCTEFQWFLIGTHKVHESVTTLRTRQLQPQLSVGVFDTTIKQLNPDTRFVFRVELIAIDVGLDATISNDRDFGELWIVSDSGSALQHLSGWSSTNDETSVSILVKLRKISQTPHV
ncbi:hypothetical protein TNCV_1913691 [Trichonephila clavipes]|nr:hypothetical protein TNCV_1913691 [Trichonephila clavipes]